MIPIAIATSDGAEFRTAMGIIVIGGLLSSTLLTLFVVPTVYTLFDDVASWPSRLKRYVSHKSHKEPSEHSVLP